MQPLAHVEFDATLDERVDVQVRLAILVPSLRASRRRARIGVGVGAGIAMLLLPFAFRLPLPLRLLLATVAGTVGYAAAGPWLAASHRRLVRQALREMGAETPVRCEVELHRDALRVCQGGIDMRVPWSDLQSVTERRGDVELCFRQAMVVVRRRAFRGEQQLSGFLGLVEQLAQPDGREPAGEVPQQR